MREEANEERRRRARAKARPSSAEVAARQICRLCSLRPTIGIVLGSGFRKVTESVSEREVMPFSRLRGFPKPRVRGHAGEIIVGRMGTTPVVVMSGRTHYYEGYSMAEITFPIRVLAAYGITHLLLTNSAGGITRGLRAGDLMLIRDHINFIPENPLRGGAAPLRRVGATPGKAKDQRRVVETGSRFLDLSQTYDLQMCELLEQAARKTRTRLKSGTYLAVSGPSYETPAEIRAFSRLGADAVGMSTVPEAIVARHCGIAVAGFSCISNMAAGLSKAPLSHAEVLAVGQEVSSKAATFIKEFVKMLSDGMIAKKPQKRRA